MFSKLKMSLVLIALLITGVVIVQANTETPYNSDIPDDNFYNYLEDQKLNSSRFSRVEDLTEVDVEHYIPITSDDTLINENSSFSMYLNEDTLNFKVLNKSTNYVWSTAMDDPEAGSYDGLLRSGIGIEYINKQQNMQIRENIGLVDTEFQLDITPINDGVKVDITVGGYCATRNCSRLYDDYLAGNYTLEQMINFGLTEIDIEFSIEVRLTEEGISAHIPYDSIVENNSDWITLSSIILFPSLGATTLDTIPGYMVIPDGIGALMRYEDNERQFLTPFEERFYGANTGITTGRLSVTSQPLSVPIFGAVHGVRQNAFIGIIESGDLNARLLAYPNGAHNLDYNLIFTKFDYKQTYRQSFSSDGSGGAMRVTETSHEDVLVHFNFLEAQEAHYTGIALNYQTYLKNRNELSPLNPDYDAIPLHTQYLMADSTSRFIGRSVIQMTTVDQVESMFNRLNNAGITNQTVSLMGWNNNGYSGHLPSRLNYENSLGRNRDFDNLISTIQENNELYLVNNFINASNATSNISYRNDVALGVNRFKITWTRPNAIYPDTYRLYPASSKELALDYQAGFDEVNAKLLMERMGGVLFSYYDNEVFTRRDAYNHYIEVFESYQGKASYVYPNAYAYQYVDTFFNMPLYNSQLKYFDDLVPLLPIILSNHMELYSEHLNYNSLGREQILALIDYGINPSFVLSDERASALRGTDIEHYYTSSFTMWENTVIEEYNTINDALSQVIGASIVDRNVIDTGIVEVVYSNNIRIIINYTSQDYTYDDLTIQALNYYVGGDGR